MNSDSSEIASKPVIESSEPPSSNSALAVAAPPIDARGAAWAIDPWAILAKLFAATLTLWGLVFHLIGFMAHRRYLTTWGLDPGPFPLATDATIIHGISALIHQVFAALDALGRGWTALLGIGMIIAYIFLVRTMERFGDRYKGARPLDRLPTTLGDAVRSIWIGSTVVSVITIMIIAATMVLAAPAILGERFGESLALKEQEKYAGGCNQKDIDEVCVELHKDGRALARGFLLEASATHVALFDVLEKRARTIERGGTELIADLPLSMRDKATQR